MFFHLFGALELFGRNLKKSFRFVSAKGFRFWVPKTASPTLASEICLNANPKGFPMILQKPGCAFSAVSFFSGLFVVLFVFLFLCSIFLHMKKVKTCVNHILRE